MADNKSARYYLDPNGYTIFFKLIAAFTAGIVFSPWSLGLVYFLAFIIVLEVIFAYQSGFRYPTDRLIERFGLFCAAFLGFLVGRVMHGDPNPLRGQFK